MEDNNKINVFGIECTRSYFKKYSHYNPWKGHYNSWDIEITFTPTREWEIILDCYDSFLKYTTLGILSVYSEGETLEQAARKTSLRASWVLEVAAGWFIEEGIKEENKESYQNIHHGLKHFVSFYFDKNKS